MLFNNEIEAFDKSLIKDIFGGVLRSEF